MKLEMNSEDNFLIYVNNLYLKLENWDSKEEITKNVKQVLLKLVKYYHIELKGFYKMSVYVNKKVGCVIELEKLEDYEFSFHTIDLKVVIYLNNTFYLGSFNDELIIEYSPIYYHDGLYYIDVDFIPDERLVKLIEMGKIIYGDEVEDVKRMGTNITLI